MSIIQTNINSEEKNNPVIVRSDIFAQNPDSRFAVGIYSPEDVLNYEQGSVHQAYLRLRARTYIDNAGFLGDEHKREDGTELDHDDERSTHFIAFENLLGSVAIIGCMRLPQKRTDDDTKLPIEEFFPECFETPAPEKSIEVSRLIVKHERNACKMMVKRYLMANAVAYTIRENLGPVYAFIEEPFRRDLSMMKVPIDVVSEPKFIEKYNTVNFGIKVDQFEFERRIGKSVIDSISTKPGSCNFFGNIKTSEDKTMAS